LIAVTLLSSLAARAWGTEWDRARLEKVLAGSSPESPANLINQKLAGLNLSGVDWGARHCGSRI